MQVPPVNIKFGTLLMEINCPRCGAFLAKGEIAPVVTLAGEQTAYCLNCGRDAANKIFDMFENFDKPKEVEV